MERRHFIKVAGASVGAALLASELPQAQAQQATGLAALQSHLRTNAMWRLTLPGAATSRPLISWAGPLSKSLPVTTLPSGIAIPVSNPLLGGPVRHRYAASLPGAPTVGGLPCLQIYRPYQCKGINRAVSAPTVLRFVTDAPVIELTGVVPDGSATSVTMMVDGMLLPTEALSSASGGGGWNYGTVRVDFGSRKVRTLWLETVLYLAHIKIGATDTLFPAGDSAEPQITVVGDSYLQVRSGTFGNGGAIALELGLRLGIGNVTMDSIGGTGYRNSGANQGNLNDRLAAHAADNSSLYVVMSGLNDYGDLLPGSAIDWGTRRQYEDAVGNYLQGLRARQPNAVIVVTAPFCPIAPMSDSTYVANASVNSSGMGDFLYKAQVHRNAVQRLAPPWVYIDVLMGSGWINSSGYTGDVTNLQWFTGGTPGPGTSVSYRPGNTNGGAGGGFGGISTIPVLNGGSYRQAPEILAYGGTGSGLILSSVIDASGRLTAIRIHSSGRGFRSGPGLPGIAIDKTFENSPATLGTPELMTGINPNGQYPLQSFAPPGTPPEDLNNIYTLIARDTIHPSPAGAEYLSLRLARNIYDAVLAL